MYSLELAFNTFAVLLLSVVIFIPLAVIIKVELFAFLKSEKVAFAAGIGLSFLVYALTFTVIIFLKIDENYYSPIFRVITLLFFSILLFQYRDSLKISKSSICFLFAFYLYVLLCQGLSAFPDLNFRNISAKGTEMLTNLPSDNLIPYQVSRYITENIDPNKTTLTSEWKLADRGPLAGILNAVVFSVLDIKDKGHWEHSGVGLFFIYQTLSVSINLLSLFIVFAICMDYFGRSTTIYAMFLLTFNFFFLINIIFTWPKFLMAFYILLSWFFLNLSTKNFWAGVFAAAALLAHDAGLFYVLALFFLIIYLYIKNVIISNNKAVTTLVILLQSSLKFILGFLIFYSPWLIAKKAYLITSNKLLYLHLFCATEDPGENISLIHGLKEYYATDGLSGIIKIKLSNLLYPVNFFFEDFALSSFITSPLSVLNNLAQFFFLRLWLAVGPVVIILFLYAVYRLRNDKLCKVIDGSGILVFLPLTIAAMLFGCPDSTANHHWCYPAFLIIMILVARLIGILAEWSRIIVAISIAFSTIVSFLIFGFHSHDKLFVHITNEYLYFIFSIILLLTLTYTVMSKIESDEENPKA